MSKIPKIIHYCWFGGNPLPEEAKKCISSWKKFCPDYVIKEWNESNFNVSSCDYIKEAYKAKKWAFVSDYARFWILYKEGGVYFDTDVELIKPIDDIVEKGSFMGCECPNQDAVSKKKLNCTSGFALCVNPGLALCANSGLALYKKILDKYTKEHFLLDSGEWNKTTVVLYTTDMIKEYGFKGNGTIEYVADIYIYPPEYFCPMNYFTGVITITDKTRSIHHYSMTWKSGYEVFLGKWERSFRSRLGNRIGFKMYKAVSLPVRAVHKTYILVKSKIR